MIRSSIIKEINMTIRTTTIMTKILMMTSKIMNIVASRTLTIASLRRAKTLTTMLTHIKTSKPAIRMITMEEVEAVTRQTRRARISTHTMMVTSIKTSQVQAKTSINSQHLVITTTINLNPITMTTTKATTKTTKMITMGKRVISQAHIIKSKALTRMMKRVISYLLLISTSFNTNSRTLDIKSSSMIRINTMITLKPITTSIFTITSLKRMKSKRLMIS